MSQAPPSEWPYRDNVSGRRYRIIVEDGYYWQLFTDGTSRRGNPAPSAAGSGPVVQSPYRMGGVQPAASTTAPRSVSLSSPYGYTNQTSSASPPGPGAYTYNLTDSDATPTPANYLSRGLGQLSLNDRATSTQSSHYQNFRTGTDPHSRVSFASADGPPASITDPFLRDNQIFASRILLGTDGEAELLDRGGSWLPNAICSCADCNKISRNVMILTDSSGWARSVDVSSIDVYQTVLIMHAQVFLVLWSEPNSATGNEASTDVTQVRFAEYVHTKIRRFVVVREGHNSCSAVPIATYGSRGVSARAVRKGEHAIIHTGKEAPRLMVEESRLRPGEQPIRGEAIRVDTFNREDKLDPTSRINLGKVYTIEHSLKVKGFGMVVDVEALERHFWEVWSAGSRSTRASTSRHAAVQMQQARDDAPGRSSGSGRSDDRQIQERSREIRDRQQKYRDNRRRQNRTQDGDESDDNNQGDDNDSGEDDDDDGETEESDEDDDEEDEETGRR
ncbi:hypothetical protein AC579_9257 [Pseudocercospora musae]|uniref:DUF6590 domain-containing protein n=1 Tax=Pseudocercospora musae TaxID=113226 RepID=A0A139IHJ9_9PEZI|nr:hypothetical protein AC579_9257 [Pseudocercospora musae]